MAYLYRHIRLDKNVPFYIGVGLQDDLEYKRAYSKKSRNVYWNNIVNTTDYEVEIIIDNISKIEAFQKEIEFIKLYKKNTEGGTLCNIADGGNGGSLGDDVNKLRSIKLKGHKLSESTKQKIAQKALNRSISNITRKKMSDSHKKNKTGHWLKSKGHENGNAKIVYQYTIDKIFIKQWDCLRYAIKELGLDKTGISNTIKGRQKSCGGYIWSLHKLN